MHISTTMNEIFFIFLYEISAIQIQFRVTFCFTMNLLECMYKLLRYHIYFVCLCYVVVYFFNKGVLNLAYSHLKIIPNLSLKFQIKFGNSLSSVKYNISFSADVKFVFKQYCMISKFSINDL